MRRNLRSPIYGIIESNLNVRKLREIELPQASLHVLQDHYAEHAGRTFYADLLQFMQSGPVAVSVWSGPIGTINAVRSIVGETDPHVAREGTIRNLFGESKQMNVIHASDSVPSAKREIELWFGPNWI